MPNQSIFRERIVVGTIFFLLLLSSFFSGEWSKWLQAIILVATFLMGFFTWRIFASGELFFTSGKRLFKNPVVYLITFLVIVLITSFFSSDKYDSFSQLFLLLSYVAIFISSYLIFRKWNLIYLGAKVIFFTGVLVAIISLVMYVNQSLPRATGLTFNANALGSYLLFSLPLGLVFSILFRGKKIWPLYFMGSLLIGIAFFLTYSYTAWVSIIIPLFIIARYVQNNFSRRKIVIIFFLLFFISFTVITVFRYQKSNDISQAIQIHKTITSEGFITSFSQRLFFNQSSLEMIRDNIFMGSGFNTFQSVYSRYAHTVIEQPRYAHNYYLQTAAEVGVLGFTAFVLFLYLLLRKSFKVVLRETDNNKKYVLLGLLAGVVGSAIHSLFDFGWQFPSVYILFWVSSGMLLAWSSQSDHTNGSLSSHERFNFNKIVKVLTILVLVLLLSRGVTLFLGVYSFDQAEESIKDLKIAEGLELYEQGLKFDPDPRFLVNLVGDHTKYYRMFDEGVLAKMENRMSQYLASNPQDYLSHWTLGRAYFVQEKYDEAESEYLAAIELNPVFRPDIYYDLAFLYFTQEKYDKVESTIRNILGEYYIGIKTSNPSLNVQLAFLYLLLGENYQAQDNKNLAEFYIRKALKLQPDFGIAQTRLKEVTQ